MQTGLYEIDVYDPTRDVGRDQYLFYFHFSPHKWSSDQAVNFSPWIARKLFEADESILAGGTKGMCVYPNVISKDLDVLPRPAYPVCEGITVWIGLSPIISQLRNEIETRFRLTMIAEEILKFVKNQPKDDGQQDPKKTGEQTHVHGKNVFGVGRDFIGNHIGHVNVGDIYAPQTQLVEYLAEKAGRTPIHIPSFEKAALWTSVCSFTAFVADIVTVIGPFGVSSANLLPFLSWSVYHVLLPSSLVFLISIVIYISFRSLRKGNSVLVPGFGSWVMREDENQRLSFEKLYAKCPCGGRIRLGLPPKGYNEPAIGRCDINPQQHIFTFDSATRFGGFWGS